MTPDLSSLSDQELNERVAVKLGYKFHEASKSIEEFGSIPLCESLDGQYHRFIPDFVSDISAAWEIIQHLRQIFLDIDVYVGDIFYTVTITRYDGPNDECELSSAQADTAPRAIVLAFLKLP